MSGPFSRQLSVRLEERRLTRQTRYVRLLRGIYWAAFVTHVVAELACGWWLVASVYRLAIGDTHDDALLGVLFSPFVIALVGYRLYAIEDRLRHFTDSATVPSHSAP